MLIGLAIWLGTDNVAAGLSAGIALAISLGAHERSSQAGVGRDDPRGVRGPTRT